MNPSEESWLSRGWRPVFGYAVALTWTVQMLGLVAGVVWAIAVEPARAGEMIGALAALVGALTAQWAVALTVLGVQVHKRSQDKQVAAGQRPAGLVDAINRARSP